MDPFAAIGTASAILSFIEFSWELLAGASEIYKSVDGTSKDNAKLNEMVINLQRFTEGLGTRHLGNSKPENDLRYLTTQCNKLLVDLVETLKTLKGNGRVLNAVKVKLKIMRKKDDISSVRGRLAEYTSQITMVINTILLDGQSGIKSQLDNIQVAGSQEVATRAKEMEVIRKTLELSVTTAHNIQRDVLGFRGEVVHEIETISKEQHMLKEVKSTLEQLRNLTWVMTLEQRILRHVFYKSMYNREEDIRNAEHGTFAWLLGVNDHNSVDQSEAGPGSRFNDQHFQKFEENQRVVRNESTKKLIAWLKQGSGVFHLSGNAGSGKSTAMKLIIHHKKTRETLDDWANNRHLVLCDHYFWSTGDDMQRSLEGLYRSVLFDVLKQCPRLIPTVFPEQWYALTGDSQRGRRFQGPIDIEESLFRPSKIKDAFDRLVTEELDEQCCLCLFVDGLDEFEGDYSEHRQLAESFRTWSRRPNVKCLVSSRPHSEFFQIFTEDTRLHLHELNERDICIFSLHMFERDRNIGRIRSFYKSLIHEVVNASEGVFLWAFLVVRILLESAGHESRMILFRKLEALPRQLGELYQRLLESLEPFDRRRAERMLLLALNDTSKLPLSSFAYSCLDMLEDPTFPFANTFRGSTGQLEEQCKLVERKIPFLTKGLLETRPTEREPGSPSLFNKRVRFLHRTVADYLRSSSVLACKSSFNLPDSYCRLRLAEIAAMEELSWHKAFLYKQLLYMFVPANHYSQDQLLPSETLFQQWEVAKPIFPPPLFVVTQEATYFDPYVALMDDPVRHYSRCHPGPRRFGERLSIPHLLAFTGHIDYVLSRMSWNSESKSAVPDLNLLLSRACGLMIHDVPDFESSDHKSILSSHKLSCRDSVQLYRRVTGDKTLNRKPAPVPSNTATVWIIYISCIWPRLMGRVHLENSLRRMLSDLASMLQHGADPDVVIGLGSSNGLSYYTTLEDTIRALLWRLSSVSNLEIWPWEDMFSKRKTTRSLPDWARESPDTHEKEILVEGIHLLSNMTPYEAHYICTRSERIYSGEMLRIF